jgi:hypothetical protein
LLPPGYTSPCKGEVDSICFASKQMLSGGGPAIEARIGDHCDRD